MNHSMPAPERRLTDAERADENDRLARALVTGAVRHSKCPLCGARPYSPCQVSPPGDHLARWLAVYSAGKITRDQLTAAVTRLSVVTKWCVVPERAA